MLQIHRDVSVIVKFTACLLFIASIRKRFLQTLRLLNILSLKQATCLPFSNAPLMGVAQDSVVTPEPASSSTSLQAKFSNKVKSSPYFVMYALVFVNRYVCRAGHKLEAALATFQINPCGLVCLDSGVSTGGFTDCLLQQGAAHVSGLC